MKTTIGVMGCGWLGLPLAQALVLKGHTVHGSTTSAHKMEVLEKEGIVPFNIRLAPHSISGSMPSFLANTTTLIINIPPKLRSGTGENYVAKMNLVLDALAQSSVKNVIFVSSTSVYGSAKGTVTEETIPQPVTASGKQLLEVETLFKQKKTFNTTIIRFGGLIGPNRHPITNLAGKQLQTNGDAPVNLIHLDDCIRITTTIIDNNYWNDTFNGVYPYHPTKREFYTEMATKTGLQPPHYKTINNGIGKRVTPNRLVNVKNFEFKTSILSAYTTEK